MSKIQQLKQKNILAVLKMKQRCKSLIETVLQKKQSRGSCFLCRKGSCVAFLSNYHMNALAKVVFNKRHYTLPAWSTSILPDRRNAVYNTARVCKSGVCCERHHEEPNMKWWTGCFEDIASANGSIWLHLVLDR